ncbi:alpha/beta fold hydrolase [Cecembia sp.]|uniref:alpha/beta hydrolase n=1 Tax=Cecembia sp. TaxID=1898110 RepID=UPI0025B7C2C8|nr:alpha/beta fold hydrolase [Cecembia sp.]
MKKAFFLLIFVHVSTILCAQDFSGTWNGSLEVMGQKIPLLFHFENDNGSWNGKMDSPSQGAIGIEMSKVLIEGPMLNFEISMANIAYDGLLIGKNIQGTFKQSDMSFPLDLTRAKDEKETIERYRPQIPHPPFTYDIIEITFNNLLNNRLFGTITKPHGNGPFPSVILITGSGPQNRNSEIFGHEPFWVMADHLSRNGIVVLRYDERGVGESEGEFSTASTLDFKDDAIQALKYLQTLNFVNPDKVGIIGHSEGGLITWMMAKEAEEIGLDFILSLAGPVVPISDLMLKQTEDVSRTAGNPLELVEQQKLINSQFYQLILDSEDMEKAKAAIPALVERVVEGYGLSEELEKQQIETLTKTLNRSVNPWIYQFLKTNPEEFILAIQIPTFAAFGGKDVQVNAAQNGNRLLELYQDKKTLLDLKVYESLNHLFQTAATGAVSEYETIEETFHIQVLEDMVEFIHSIGIK